MSASVAAGGVDRKNAIVYLGAGHQAVVRRFGAVLVHCARRHSDAGAEVAAVV